jgi:hypothetical protein
MFSLWASNSSIWSSPSSGVACLIFSLAPRHIGCRDRFIRWTPLVRRQNLHLLAYQSRNGPKEVETLLAHCLTFARRNFVNLVPSFPEECRFVIEALAQVYHYDKMLKEQGRSVDLRLQFHQAHSAPVMERLKEWLQTQPQERKVEPTSSLGKAIAYMPKHWEPLTLFLRVPGAPLDNNLREQVLKRAILRRKNSLFFRTELGAYIGDLFMSLIHTCKLNQDYPFHYLTTLQKHSSQLFKNPGK